MNDEKKDLQNGNSENATGSDPSPSETTQKEGSETADESPLPCDKDDTEDPALFGDPAPNPDPDPMAPAVQAPSDELECLRGELKRLREELAAREAMPERIARESEEFHTLYPNVPMSEVSDDVWEDVRRGIPVAAAYALAERRRACTIQKAAECNTTNQKRSAGGLSPTEPDYFSPAEVRAMSQSEVRANYQKIMRSMQKWR